MKFNEIKSSSSIKYEFWGNVEEKIAPLFLKGMFSVLRSTKEPATFIGFVNGDTQLRKLNIYFVTSDEELISFKSNNQNKTGVECFPINIRYLSATKFPAKISKKLRAICLVDVRRHNKEQELLRMNAKTKELEKNLKKLETKLNDSVVESVIETEKQIATSNLTNEPSNEQKEFHKNIEKFIKDKKTTFSLSSRRTLEFKLEKIFYIKEEFRMLPRGIDGYREDDGVCFITSPEQPKCTELVLDYMIETLVRDSNPLNGAFDEYAKRRKINFNKIHQLLGINDEKFKTFDVDCLLDFVADHHNDESANILIEININVQELTEETLKELNDLFNTYSEYFSIR